MIVILCFVFLFSLQLLFNPFYIITSGSMLPTLVQEDMVITSDESFFDLKVGDIIVFKSNYNNLDRTYVHRIVEIMDDDERYVKTKGDYNPSSLEGLDYPIKESNYVGKVIIVLPKIGMFIKIFSPPINYYIMIISSSLLLFFFRKNIFYCLYKSKEFSENT
ncbi:signal peptidase I [Nitrosopumilus ureiphilus]|uniref:Signal peptidase I n=1 Tax=Nitrosopumilus ureiphilus TaxID=1470067 RepID=A0A7D5RGD7_9ARCH|nr:signal peptidase I [Nitrosopumilus ureiphilus]QLH06665.1 signal peptidase I [Nitrosopumilus ureiphilus]